MTERSKAESTAFLVTATEGSTARTDTRASNPIAPDDEALREALAELAEAAGWAANQPDPRKAASGYSWFAVAREQVDTLLPPGTMDEEQVRIFREGMRGGAF